MSRWYDEDGIDGPFDREMARAMRLDAQRARRRAQRQAAGARETRGLDRAQLCSVGAEDTTPAAEVAPAEEVQS